MQKIESLLWVPASIDDVWTFFSNPRNVATVTPRYFGLEIESESDIKDGSTVVMHLKPWFFPTGFRWISKIHEVTATGPERRFVDMQAAGPFRHWKHTHQFSSGMASVKNGEGKTVQIPDGGTWIRDVVECSLPFGPLGVVTGRLFSQPQLQAMFEFRRTEIEKLFKTDSI
jgi:ligand-binding SRPBCC domain-containing protein